MEINTILLFVLDIHTWTFLQVLQEAHTTVTMMATTGVFEFHCVSGGFPCGLYRHYRNE